jgi:predicted transcriptional regulator
MQQVLFELERETRTIILSLNPIPFENIFNGSKKYEYRRKFLKEAISAFIYVSSPVKEMRGYIEFGKPIFDKIDRIAEIAEQEKPGGRQGILKYMEGLEMGFAIPILTFRKIQPLSLEELRSHYNFTAPQSYINLESNPKLEEALMRRKGAFL